MHWQREREAIRRRRRRHFRCLSDLCTPVLGPHRSHTTITRRNVLGRSNGVETTECVSRQAEE